MSTITQVIPVPQSGLGASVDVSSMVGPKTVFLTGRFKGAYVLYGSQDGTHFAPLFQFDAGGVEGIRQTFKGALARLAIKSLAVDAVGVTASVSGESVLGDNTFVVLGILSPGASGPQPSYDLGVSNFQSDVSFLLAGGLEGKLVVEGSPDNVGWNPVGQFSVDPSGPGLLGPSSPEFVPLETDDLVRYVRLNVLGRVVGGLVVTVGGSKGGGGGGASQTLAQTYQVGATSADQTMVLVDVRGGPVVFDGSKVGFTGDLAVSVMTPSGVGGAFRRTGGLLLGPDSILIDTLSEPSSVAGSSAGTCIGNACRIVGSSNTAVGRNVVVNTTSAPTDNYQSVGVGVSVNVQGINSQGVGSFLTVTGDQSCAHGSDGTLVGKNSVLVAVGDSFSHSTLYGSQCVVIGHSISVGEVGSPVDYAIACGSEASVVGIGGVAIGRSAFAGVGGESGASNVAVGDGAIANNDLRGGYGAVSVGVSANGYGDGNVLVGAASSVFGTSNVAIGQSHVVGTAAADFDFNTVCGYQSAVWGGDSVVIGREHTVGVDVDHTTDRVVVVGSAIEVATAAELSIAIGFDMTVAGTGNIVIGSGAGSGALASSGIAVGEGATVSHAISAVFGVQAVSTAANQVVFGTSASTGAFAVHDFVVRGYNGGVLNTLEAIDNPVDSGNPDRGVTGLTVVYIQNNVVTNKTLKAAPYASLPAGALVAYFEAPPA
jgi:hypothetical protein